MKKNLYGTAPNHGRNFSPATTSGINGTNERYNRRKSPQYGEPMAEAGN